MAALAGRPHYWALCMSKSPLLTPRTHLQAEAFLGPLPAVGIIANVVPNTTVEFKILTSRDLTQYG